RHAYRKIVRIRHEDFYIDSVVATGGEQEPLEPARTEQRTRGFEGAPDLARWQRRAARQHTDEGRPHESPKQRPSNTRHGSTNLPAVSGRSATARADSLRP